MKKQHNNMEKKRFLFDIHDFDKPEKSLADKEIENIPPAPTYSEDELRASIESAKEEGFRRGKQEGFRESEEGFTQKIYEITKTLGDDIKQLLETEEARHSKFSQEASKLIATALETALPALMEQGDFISTQYLISELLETHQHEESLAIHTDPEYIEPLQAYFEKRLDDQSPKLKFIPQESSTEGALSETKITWEHGGAVRNPKELQENILKVLQVALAENELTPQNEDDKQPENTDE
jgi:flagellar biosynthesis/type III secretory pathway protein FliH